MHLIPKIARQPTSCSARVMVRTLFLKHKTSLRKYKNIGHVMTILSFGACLLVRLRALVRVRGAWLPRRLLPRRDSGLCPSLPPSLLPSSLPPSSLSLARACASSRTTAQTSLRKHENSGHRRRRRRRAARPAEHGVQLPGRERTPP